MSCTSPMLFVDYGTIENKGKTVRNIKPYRSNISEMESIREIYNPKYGYGKLMLLPCGHCPSCIKDYARTWQARIMCEKEYHEKTSFLTLTYADNPPNRPLRDDLRDFIKDVRNKFGKGIKFFGCGEKGDLNGRSHYHLILFGVDFSEDRELFGRRGLFYTYISKTATKLWHRGHVLIGDLDIASAGYVAKYCMKKRLIHEDNGEFLIMSRGLGRKWFEEHYKDLVDSDFLYFNGNKFKIPRYFLKLADNLDFYYQACFEDYKNRKAEVAQNFRYNSLLSMKELDAINYQLAVDLDILDHKEVLRDVD